jgi:Ca-activated chloride channel family protein
MDVLSERSRRTARSRLGEAAAVARLVEGEARGRRSLRSLLGAAAVLLLAVACARPQWGVGEADLTRRGVDLFICVDVSKSMLAEDVKPNRLARARLAVDSFIDRLAGDRVGLIAYAGEARVLCPLTLDHSAARLFLDTLDVQVLQRPGTAIGKALELARESLAQTEGRHGVVLLLSDGEDHGGEAEDAALALAEQGVVVHAIGIGKPEGEPIPIYERDTRTGRRNQIGFVKDQEGSAVMTRLDAVMLSEIAAAGGGRYFRASSSEAGLVALAGDIARMEKADFASHRTVTRTDRYQWFLLPALLLIAMELALPSGRFFGRRRSRSSRVSAAAMQGRREDAA